MGHLGSFCYSEGWKGWIYEVVVVVGDMARWGDALLHVATGNCLACA